MSHNKVKDVIFLKKMFVSGCVGAFCGAGVTIYALTNKKTKKNADKLLNNIMEEANQVIKKMS
jgi:homoserine kinase